MPKIRITKTGFVKKVFASIFVFLYFFSVSLSYFPTPALAQETTWYNQDFVEWYKKVYDNTSSPSNEIFGERYTAAQVQWVVYGLISFPLNFFTKYSPEAFSCLLSLTPGVSINELACATSVASLVKDAVDVLKVSGKLSDSRQNEDFFAYVLNGKNISGIRYLHDLKTKLSPVGTVNAQGFGYTSAISDLKIFWGGFRDIAYAISVFAIIIFAFMVMFRVKINPQTVISIQSAVPKVIVAIILATFSYAIAGFVIDLSYVLGGLFASLVKVAGFESSVKLAFDAIVPIEGAQGAGGFYILFWMFSYTVIFLVASFISIFGPLIGGLSVYGTLAGFVMFLLTIWVALLMLWYTIKVPWVLLKNLVSLYISIVIAPVQIVIGAVAPSIGFGLWFRKIIAEAMVFPVTGLFMFFAAKTALFSIAVSWNEIIEILNLNIKSLPGNMWAPPILGSSDDMAGVLWLGVSFVFITLIPKAVDITKMLIMGAKFDYGTAIGEAMAPIDSFRKWGPTRAVSDMISAQGAAKALSSKPIRWVAEKFGQGQDLDRLIERATKQVTQSR